jgi:LPS-assembly protein
MTSPLSFPLRNVLAALAVLAASPLAAQTSAAAGTEAPREVDFASDTLEYDNEAEIVTARGAVAMESEGNRLRADEVIWNRKSGQVFAKGNVTVTNPGGDTAYGDTIELTDTLKDGVISNLLIVLADGGRLAAINGVRDNGVSTLDRAVYSPCKVENEDGCPKDPAWKISALKVIHDPKTNRISYKNARLDVFGVPILALPGFSHPANNEGGSGLLVPDIQVSRSNGVELTLPYYLRIAPNRDLVIAPHVYSEVLPMLETRYRALTSKGAYTVAGYATYGSRLPTGTVGSSRERDFRGYLEGSGKFQLTPRWSITGAGRLTTDRTFLRRYDISRDDRLRNVITANRISRTSFLEISGWGFQTLRAGDPQGQQPIALPLIDYRKRIDDKLLGGKAEFQLNSLAIGRTSGQDTQRAFASARWDLRRITSLGQEVIITGYARGDVYHTDEAGRTLTAIYRGRNGWESRGIAAAAVEARWPFVGTLFGGTQRLTPRVQFVASPKTRNLQLPNEDARSVDLEDSNLFALNRFPGYDRWEDGARMTYGLDWGLDLPGFSLETTIGQSYRFTRRPALFPNGTGLNDSSSDVVGRTTIKYRRLLSLTHRYRLDKDNFAVRRNEVDITFGTDTTYISAGYLRLNRDVDRSIEDLRDREELRIGGRVQIARYWSVFGSAIVDLTDRREDPLSLADGYDPVRHRLGIAYEDDCLRFGLTWRRDYDPAGDARRGNTYQLKISFKNVGF